MVRRGLPALALLVALGLQGCGSSATYEINSGSMEPTLKIHQVVTANSISGRPGLGDIVTFHPPSGAIEEGGVCGDPHEGSGHPQMCGVPTPTAARELILKRVVGLPGNRISMVDGHVIRNGVRERDPYIYPCENSTACSFPKPIVIPPREYFMLGDNRGESYDSRFWGPVKRAWITGLIQH